MHSASMALPRGLVLPNHCDGNSLVACSNSRRWLGVATYSTFSSVFLYLPFYRALDARFGVAVTLQSVAAKVVLDDLLFVPGVEIPSFFVWSGTVEGKNVRGLFERDYLSTLIAGLWFNIPVTILNFTVVPPHLRVLVVDVAEMAWCGILSHFSHRPDTVLPGPDAVPPVVVSPNFIRAPQPRAQCKDPDARRPS